MVVAVTGIFYLFLQHREIPIAAESSRITLSLGTSVASLSTGNSTDIDDSVSQLELSPAESQEPNGLLCTDLPQVPLQGRSALQANLMLLQRTEKVLEGIATYQATFAKRERISGVLGAQQVVEMKVRHAPFSIYMKWTEGNVGQEALYVEGQQDNNMIVRLGGIKGRIFPPLSLDPNGSRALSESRYPIADAGLLELVRKIINYRLDDLESDSGIHCALSERQDVSGCDCYCFVIDYDSPDVSQAARSYRKSICYLDKDSFLPIEIQNFTWPDGDISKANVIDESTLIEHYSFSNIDLDCRLADVEFDRSNPGYRLQKR